MTQSVHPAEISATLYRIKPDNIISTCQCITGLGIKLHCTGIISYSTFTTLIHTAEFVATRDATHVAGLGIER
jgi:hypothetical protein